MQDGTDGPTVVTGLSGCNSSWYLVGNAGLRLVNVVRPVESSSSDMDDEDDVGEGGATAEEEEE